MYFYAAERFLVVVVLLCLCIAVLKLSPLALLGGICDGSSDTSGGPIYFEQF